MSIDPITLLFADTEPLETAPAPVQTAAMAFRLWWPVIIGVHLGVLLSLFGLALLISLVARTRHERALTRLQTRPVLGFVVGTLVLLLIIVGFSALHNHGVHRGQPLMIWIFAIGVATGLSVCARGLGQRAHDNGSASAQTAIGMAVLLLTALTPIGLPIIAIAAPLGLGAWLTAPREKIVM